MSPNKNTYAEALKTAINELSSLMEEREILESRQAELDERLVRLRKGVAGISLLAGEDWLKIKDLHPHLFPDSLSPDIGMTEAVRKVLQTKDAFLSPINVRADLQKGGYDVENHKNLLASLHTILKRLTEAGEVETATREDRTVYKWKRGHKMFRQGTAVSCFDNDGLPSIGPAKK